MRRLVVVLFVFIFGRPCSAGFIVVDDFESGNLSNWIIEFYGEEEASELGSITIVDDPFNRGQGNVMRIDPGVAGGLTHNVIGTLPIPRNAQIEGVEGQKSTFYFKMAIPSAGETAGRVHHFFGLSTEDADSVTHFSRHAVQARIIEDGIIQYRDEGNVSDSFQPIAQTSHDLEVYYEIWFVVDHWNFQSSMYIRGGSDFSIQTRVSVDADFRFQSLENISRILIFSSAGNIFNGVRGVEALYFDDFMIDPSGENLNFSTVRCVEVVNSNLVNISTRGKVGPNDAGLIGGFVIDGNSSRKVLLQAVGMELENIDDTFKLSDPQFRLVPMISKDDESTHMIIDDWDDDQSNTTLVERAADVLGATKLVPGSGSAAMLVTLEPGAYTVVVSGVGGAEGIALLEVYEYE
ncbi:hypothetical protein MLD52_14505 [Puniceicoccaceae bacterium K14]|nr:hypothetical protein [Puniceicoccaceae bacterium K14]